jgi:hypothetical protein
MKTTIRLLARLVERFPVMVVHDEPRADRRVRLARDRGRRRDRAGRFAPESEEILAASRIGELFGDEAIQSVMQVVIRIEVATSSPPRRTRSPRR